MKRLSPQPQLVFHDAAALDAAHCMLDPHSNAVDTAILFLFSDVNVPPRGFFFG